MKQILTIYVCLLLFPLQIKAYNIQGKIIDQIENDMCTGENPRRFSRIEMKQLLTDLY